MNDLINLFNGIIDALDICYIIDSDIYCYIFLTFFPIKEIIKEIRYSRI